MTQDRIAKASTGGLGLAPALDWTFARTYAQTAPHSYVVLGRTAGITKDDFVHAGRVIHTFGRPAKFYGMTSIYLTSPDRQMKWWTMAARPGDRSCAYLHPLFWLRRGQPVTGSTSCIGAAGRPR
jgi:hypothetical protein